MSLQDVWRGAIDRIAASNDDAVVASVRNERERIERERKRIEQEEGGGQQVAPRFSPALANSIRERHTESDLGKLLDYVVYLIWGKLTQRWLGELPDRFLGITDLEAYLLSREPGRYHPPDLSAFLLSLGPPTQMGNVRAFLCARGAKNLRGNEPAASGPTPRTAANAKRKVRRQLYSHDQLDRYLLAEDLEEYRRAPPPSVFEGMSTEERAQAMKQLQRRTDRDLADALLKDGWRGIPLAILGWAHMITHQLVTGSCDCPTAFLQTARAYGQAQTRCGDYHFLCQHNLDRAMRFEPKVRLGLAQQKKPMADSLRYVEMAVIEKMVQLHPKTLAKTMLGNVFVTPGQNKLRLTYYLKNGRWIEGLTETGRDAIRDVAAKYRVFGCPGCLSLVGGRASICKCIAERHFWCSGSIPPEDHAHDEPQVEGAYVKVSVAVCPSKHFWPAEAGGSCPLCGQQPVVKKLSVEVFCPRNRTHDDGEDWRETLV